MPASDVKTVVVHYAQNTNPRTPIYPTVISITKAQFPGASDEHAQALAELRTDDPDGWLTVEPGPWATAERHPNLPDLEGFTTYYGVQVSVIGDQGALLILGHPGKLRALAALNAYARRESGLWNLLDIKGPDAADLEGILDCIVPQWAVLMPTPYDGDLWALRWVDSAYVDGAFPVTTYEAL
jgi:hypothetical protein